MIAASEHPRELERISALVALDILDSKSEIEFDELTLLAATVCDTPISLVSLVDRDRQWFKSRHGLTAEQTPRNLSFCGHAILQNGLFEISDATKDPRFFDNPLVVGNPNVHYYAGIPLVPSDGLPIGTLCVIDHKPRKLTPTQVDCLRALANQVQRVVRLRQINRGISAVNQRLQYHQAALASMSEGVVLQSADGTVLEINSAAPKVLGMSVDQLLGRREIDLQWRAFREDGTPYETDDSPAMATLRSGIGLRETRVRLELPSGEGRWLEVNTAPIFGEDASTPERVVSTIRDITEQRNSQRAHLQNAKMLSLGLMASGVAHEINNPLSIIIGRAYGLKQTLARGEISRERTLADVDQIERTAGRIAKIVRGLSTFARGGPLDPLVSTSVTGLVADVLDLFQEKFRLLDLEVRKKLPVPDITVRCRAVQISQVLLNLIFNAQHAITSLDEKWIEISAEERDGRIHFAVTDSGAGIPPKIAERIFEPFFTTKAIGQGTGLGLSISQGIIESHGGNLRLDATSTRTRFTFDFPV